MSQFVFCKHASKERGKEYAPACSTVVVRHDERNPPSEYRLCIECFGLVVGFIEGKCLP